MDKPYHSLDAKFSYKISSFVNCDFHKYSLRVDF